MAEFDNDEISDEEKLQIAQHFLLSSPPGQFHEILSDVRKLLPDDLLTDALATGMARVYNTRNRKVVTAPSGEKTVVSAACEVDSTHYIDPNTGSIYGIDHLTLATTEDHVDHSIPQQHEASRRAVQSAVSQYVGGTFRQEETGCGVFETKDGNLVVCITSEKPNLRNYWAGKWSSIWTIRHLDGNPTISGEIKIHAHYFEDGNVQLQTTKSIPETQLSVQNHNLADAVVATISKTEATLRSGLDEIFNNLNTETLRAMRRTMPITRTKMEWNVNSVRMIRQVRK